MVLAYCFEHNATGFPRETVQQCLIKSRIRSVGKGRLKACLNPQYRGVISRHPSWQVNYLCSFNCFQGPEGITKPCSPHPATHGACSPHPFSVAQDSHFSPGCSSLAQGHGCLGLELYAGCLAPGWGQRSGTRQPPEAPSPGCTFRMNKNVWFLLLKDLCLGCFLQNIMQGKGFSKTPADIFLNTQM